MLYLVTLVLFIVLYILFLLPLSKMFEKAGVDSVKAYIPIYNLYILYKITWKTCYFWVFIILVSLSRILNSLIKYDEYAFLVFVLLAFEIIIIVLDAGLCINTSKAYGHKTGYAIGLFFLEVVFNYIIGFGESVYVGNESERQIKLSD